MPDNLKPLDFMDVQTMIEGPLSVIFNRCSLMVPIL
jgi:hypothetical protein